MNNLFENAMATHMREQESFAPMPRKKPDQPPAEEAGGPQVVPEDMILEAVAGMDDQALRRTAAVAAIAWVSEGDPEFDSLDAFVQRAADLDGDGDIGDDEEELYNELLALSGDFLAALGGGKVTAEAISAAIEKEDEADDAFESILETLKSCLEASDKSDGEIVNSFAVGNAMILEAMQRVVRDGKVVFVKKKLRKKKMTARQKAALKKAQLKAHTAAAKAKRSKSNRLRNSKGMD